MVTLQEHSVGRNPPTDDYALIVHLRSPRQAIVVVSPTANADGKRAYSKRGPMFDGRVDGRVIVERSHQPFLDAARRLLAEGCDPEATLAMRHIGSDTDSLRGPLWAAAKLLVKEGDCAPRLSRWKLFFRDAVVSPMRQNELPARLTRPEVPGRTSEAGDV